MRTEISNAVNFLSNLLRARNPSQTQLASFRDALTSRFTTSFTNHWFPERPLRGNAYRCVRIVSNKMDRLVAAAGRDADLSEQYLCTALPQELTVWIDPGEVSYRIGEDGSVGIIYSVLDSVNANGSTSSDDEIESCSSSSSCESLSSVDSSSSTSLPSGVPAQFAGSGLFCGMAESLSSLRVSPDTVNRAYLISACAGN